MILALDMLRKEELASLKGGTAGTNKVCGCVCVGPATPIKCEVSGEVSPVDENCADCGASNAHRTSNEPTV